MGITDLPQEVIDLIIQHVLNSIIEEDKDKPAQLHRGGSITFQHVVGSTIERNKDYRMVCRSFNTSIIAIEIERMARKPLERLCSKTQDMFFFLAHGGKILSIKAQRSAKGEKYFAAFIRDKVEIFIKHQVHAVQGPQRNEDLRLEYTRTFCEAFLALDYRIQLRHNLSPKVIRHLGKTRDDANPARSLMCTLAAAAGDAKTLFSFLKHPTDLVENAMLMNALDAAVACKNPYILALMLEYLRAGVRGDSYNNTASVVDVGKAVHRALVVAIKLHRTQEGYKLIYFLLMNPCFSQSSYSSRGRNLVRTCMEYANAPLAYAAVALSQNVFSPDNIEEYEKMPLTITSEEMVELFARGNSSALRAFLKAGVVHPDVFCANRLPLWYALFMDSDVLRNSNFLMGRILLEHGARVDAVIDEHSGLTALETAIHIGNARVVTFLNEYITDHDSFGEYGACEEFMGAHDNFDGHDTDRSSLDEKVEI